MRFCHAIGGKSIPEHIKMTLEEQPARSGMYNWIFALRGSIMPLGILKDRLDEFDVIQCNMSPVDMPMITELRRLLKGSSTKLVLNNDYVCEYWDKWEIDPWYYRHIQRMGDMVFGTEPHQVSQMIDGTFCIPHPTNTKALKHLGTAQKRDSIGIIHHWWNPNIILPWLMAEKVKKEFKIKKSTLYGYKEFHPTFTHSQKWISNLFEDIEHPQLFGEFAEKIQAEKIVYDPNGYHTYGRNGVELACWRKPVIGSNRVFSYNMLFPELSCDPFDAKQTFEKFKLALTGEIDHILDRAYEEVEYFNYENSVKRFKEAFDIAIDRGGYEWYQNQ